MVSVFPYVHAYNVSKEINDRQCSWTWWVTEFARLYLSYFPGSSLFAVTANTSFTPRWPCVTKPLGPDWSSSGLQTHLSMQWEKMHQLWSSSKISRRENRSSLSSGLRPYSEDTFWVSIKFYYTIAVILWPTLISCPFAAFLPDFWKLKI